MKCPNCGREIANDSRFCEFCGARVEQVAPSPNQQRRLSTTQLIIIVAASVISFIAILVLVFYRPVLNPTHMPAIVEEYPDSACSDEVEPVVDLVDSAEVELNNDRQIYLRGTVAGCTCELEFDFQSGQGEYRQYLNSGETVFRTLRHRYYEGDGVDGELVLDAYDSKGQCVSQFRGTLSNNCTRYSGSITNTRGGSLSFDMRQ